MPALAYSVSLKSIEAIFGGRKSFTPSSLFAASEPGGWYDPSDLTTLYQDAAGTTPVTAVEQPVGLVLDKSRGLVLGSELVDTANSVAAWTTGGTNVLEQDGDAIKITFVDSSTGASLSLTAAGGLTQNLVADRTYKVTCQCKINTGSANVAIVSAGTNPVVGFSSTSFSDVSFVFIADGTNETLRVSSLGTGEIVWIRNISVRELPGSHLSQSTAAARLVLSARVNLLTRTEEFDNAAWTKPTGGSISATNSTTAPDGTVTADTWLQTSTPGATYLGFRTITVPASTALTVVIHVKKVTGRWVRLFLADNATLGVNNAVIGHYDLDTGLPGASSSNGTGSSVTACTISSVPNGFYRLTLTGTLGNVTSAMIGVRIVDADNSSTNLADGSLYIWGADLRPTNAGVGLPAYQRVGAATSGSSTAAGNADYDTTGFPYYLRWDGTDDGMASSSIDFSGTDKMAVFAGVRKLSDAAAGMLAELSASVSANVGSFFLTAPDSTSIRYSAASRGTTAVGSSQLADTASTSFNAPVTNVLRATHDIAGDVTALAVNGTVVDTATGDQGTGNFGNYPLFVGCRNNASSRFNGHIYGLVIVGRALTAAEISSMESWMAAKTGVTL